MESVFELGVVIKAVDMLTGPLRGMVGTLEATQGKFSGLTKTMEMMGKSKGEIDAINSSLAKMGDRQAFSDVAGDLNKIGMAKQDIAAMESSFMKMRQYQRDMADAQAKYAAGKDLAMSGVGDLTTGALGAAGIFELVKKAGEFQANMTVIQDSTGASTKQMNDFGNAVMNTSAAVSKFNDMQVSQIAQALTSGGFGKIQDAQALLTPVAKYAESQVYEHKAGDPLESTKQAIDMAHIFGNYDPKSFENFLNTFNKYSMMQPGSSTDLENTLKYLAPTALSMKMKPDDIMALAAVDNTLGLNGSHGGTNSADMIMRLIPGLIGGAPTKKKTPKAWQAMQELGFIDANGNSKFFNKQGGLTDLNGMLTTMIGDSKKFNPMQLTGLYKDIFGIQGGRAANILAQPRSLEQLQKMQKQLGKTKSMEQINNDLQKTPEGQLNLLKSNSMTLMLRVGQQLATTLNPAIASVNKLLSSTLKFSQAHPVVSKLVGDFAMLMVGGKLLQGVFKIVAGNFQMIGAAFRMFKISSEAGELTKFGSVAMKVGAGLKKLGEITKLGGIFSRVGTAIRVAFAAISGIGFGPIVLGIAAVAAAGFLIYKNWGTIGPFVKKTWNEVKTYTVGVWKSISPTIMLAVNSVWSSLKSAWGSIVSFTKSIWPQVSQIVKNAFAILGPIVMMELKNIWIAIQTAGKIIVADFKFIWAVLVPVVQTAWKLIGDYIRMAWDVITGIIKVGLDLLTGNWKGAWTQFQNTTKQVWSDIGRIFHDGWAGIQNIAKSWGVAAMQWGRDIVSGLSNGISSMWGNVVSTVQNLGSKISSTFKGMLGIHSPSRVFIEHGKNIVQGLSLGIDRNSGLANRSTMQLANGVTGSFNPKMPIAVAKNQSTSADSGGGYQDHSQIIFQAGSVVVNAQAGQDAKSLARDTMKELGKMLRNQGYRTGRNPVNSW